MHALFLRKLLFNQLICNEYLWGNLSVRPYLLYGFELRDVQLAHGNKERCGFVEFSGASAGTAC
jgi:hypothetical protein